MTSPVFGYGPYGCPSFRQHLGRVIRPAASPEVVDAVNATLATMNAAEVANGLETQAELSARLLKETNKANARRKP